MAFQTTATFKVLKHSEPTSKGSVQLWIEDLDNVVGHVYSLWVPAPFRNMVSSTKRGDTLVFEGEPKKGVDYGDFPLEGKTLNITQFKGASKVS